LGFFVPLIFFLISFVQSRLLAEEVNFKNFAKNKKNKNKLRVKTGNRMVTWRPRARPRRPRDDCSLSSLITENKRNNLLAEFALRF